MAMNLADMNLPIPAYFKKYINLIAKYCNWPMDPVTGGYEFYLAKYKPTLDIIQKYGGDTSISDWDPLVLEEMLLKAQRAGYGPPGNTTPYADSTVEGWRLFLKKVYGYAAYTGHSPDKMAYLEELKRCSGGLNLATDKPLKERRKEFASRYKSKRNARRSLTIPQLQIVIELAVSMLSVQGLALAILILIYTGMRPSEVLGLKVGDYLQYIQHDGFYLSVVRQVYPDGSIKNRLKRRASYRKVPVHFELQRWIEARIAQIREHLPEDEELEQCPLCCWGNNFSQHCKPYRLSALAKDLLSRAHVESMVYENVLLDLYLTEPTLRNPEAEEFNFHTYLLRHTFWTMIQSSCELDADEKRIIFGHAVWHDRKEINPRFNYEECLWHIHQMLQHIVFHPKFHQSFMEAHLEVGCPVVRKKAGELTLMFPAEALKKGGNLTVLITSQKKDNPISVESLPEVAALYPTSPPVLSITPLPSPNPVSKSLTCDLHSWRNGKWHMKKRK